MHGSPGDTCTQCCCCVVTSAGIRNFCAKDGGNFEVDTIPNCYYLQSHLDVILTDLNDQGNALPDSYTIPGRYLFWRPTDPAYGCFKDLATVTPTNIANTTPLPTVGVGVTGNAPGTVTSPNANSGGCVFNGGNQTGIICGNNTNGNSLHSAAGVVRVNHTVLLCCMVIVLAFALAKADTNMAGGCIFNGGNQTNSNCNDNSNINPSVKSSGVIRVKFPMLSWAAVVVLFLFFGCVMGQTIVGGCLNTGGSQHNLNCINNTVVIPEPVDQINGPSPRINNGLSPGEISGIAIGCVAAFLAIPAAAASLVNPNAKVKDAPIWNYRRAALYRFVEGLTLGWGCGCLHTVQHRMQGFVERGGRWGWSESSPR